MPSQNTFRNFYVHLDIWGGVTTRCNWKDFMFGHKTTLTAMICSSLVRALDSCS